MNTVDITVNGALRQATIEPRTSLADFLRDNLSLTGTHLGCEHGICGACTVLINGEISRSCITSVHQHESRLRAHVRQDAGSPSGTAKCLQLTEQVQS